MRIPLQHVQLDRTFVAAGQHRSIGHPLEDRLLAGGLRKRIGQQRPRPRPRLLVERGVCGVRDDRSVFRGVAAQSAGMVEVQVGVDHHANRLVGDLLLRFGNDHVGPRFILRCFDDDHVIAHVHSQAVMRTASDPEDAVGDLLRRGRRCCGCRGVTNGIGHRDVDERVDLDRRDRQVEGRIAALRLHDACGERNTVERAVTRVGGFHEHVAEDVVRHPPADPIHLVHLVDVDVQRISAANRQFDLCAIGDRLRQRGAGGLQRALRRCCPQPQYPLSRGGRLRLERWCAAAGRLGFVPRERAAGVLNLALLSIDRPAPAARRRRRHRQHLFDAHAARHEFDLRGIALHDPGRPWLCRGWWLAEHE